MRPTTDAHSYRAIRRTRSRRAGRRRRRLVLRPAGRRCLAAAAAAAIFCLNGIGALLHNEAAHTHRSGAAGITDPTLHLTPAGATEIRTRGVATREREEDRDSALLPSRGGFERVPAYARYVATSNPDLSEGRARQIARLILASSDRYRIDPRLVTAMIEIESGFRPRLVSSAGAVGLCQMLPRTARGLRLGDPRIMRHNVDGSVRYLRGQFAAFHGRPHLALAAYNAGETAVRRYHGVPPFHETRQYVRRVLRLYRKLCRTPHRATHSRVAGANAILPFPREEGAGG
jgi:hypothetical protein